MAWHVSRMQRPESVLQKHQYSLISRALLVAPPRSMGRIDVTARFDSFISVPVLLALCVVMGAPSFAKDACDAAQLTEVYYLGKLPSPIRHLLPSATGGLHGIADRGEHFNVTDVVDDRLPMRRFTLAAVGSTCALIAVEYGGIAHGFEVTEFRLTAAGWQSVWRRPVVREPSSIAELLRAAP